MRASPAITVLVIEDDEETLSNVRSILEQDGFPVVGVRTAREGLDQLSTLAPGAIILDRRLPDARAQDAVPEFRAAAPLTPLIVVTGYGDTAGAIEALRQGAVDYLLKPIDPQALLTRLRLVDDRQRLEQANRRSETALRVFLEAAEFLVLIIRTDLSILYISPFTERLLGRTLEEVKDHDSIAVFQPIRSPEFTREVVRRLLAGETVRGVEEQIALPTGCRWVVWNANLLDDYEGAQAIMVVGQDLTRLKEAQQRVLQAERLAAIGQTIAGLAHESRNALQRSQACLEMLALEVRDRPAALSLIDRLQAAQNHLAHLYEDVQGYARPLRIDLRRGRLADAWREAWAQLAGHPALERARLDEALLDADTSCLLDEFRMIQVFRNVFENSLAASPIGPIKVRVTCGPALLAGEPALGVVVRDHGPGLTEEQRERVFEPFFSTKVRGTGLGMPIAKRIVEAHGGRIAIGRCTGPGTAVELTIPRGSTR